MALLSDQHQPATRRPITDNDRPMEVTPMQLATLEQAPQAGSRSTHSPR